MRKQQERKVPLETLQAHQQDFEKEKKKLDNSFKKKGMPFRLVWVK